MVAGITCAFVFPEQGMNMAGSSILIAFSYLTVLFRPKKQWMESLILLSVITVTIFAYIFPETWNGALFLVQLLYFFYGIGKALIIEANILGEFKDFNWFWRSKVHKGK